MDISIHSICSRRLNTSWGEIEHVQSHPVDSQKRMACPIIPKHYWQTILICEISTGLSSLVIYSHNNYRISAKFLYVDPMEMEVFYIIKIHIIRTCALMFTSKPEEERSC